MMDRTPLPAVSAVWVVSLARRAFVAAILIAAVPSHPLTLAAAGASKSTRPARATVPLPRPEPSADDEVYARTPLSFEQTAGRAASGADFIARGAGYLVGLAGDHLTLVVGSPSEKHRLAIGMRLIGASPSVRANGRREVMAATNRLAATDARQAVAAVHTFAEVEYSDVYPGIDVVYYGNQRQLEYDFIVKPRADYRSIALGFDGARSVRVDRSGRLIIATAVATIVQRVPALYQEIDGTRKRISGGFVQRAGNRIGFWVGRHDESRPFVIDPVVGRRAADPAPRGGGRFGPGVDTIRP